MNARIIPTRNVTSVTMPKALAPQSWITTIRSVVRKRALPTHSLPNAIATSPRKRRNSSSPCAYEIAPRPTSSMNEVCVASWRAPTFSGTASASWIRPRTPSGSGLQSRQPALKAEVVDANQEREQAAVPLAKLGSIKGQAGGLGRGVELFASQVRRRQAVTEMPVAGEPDHQGGFCRRAQTESSPAHWNCLCAPTNPPWWSGWLRRLASPSRPAFAGPGRETTRRPAQAHPPDL